MPTTRSKSLRTVATIVALVVFVCSAALVQQDQEQPQEPPQDQPEQLQVLGLVVDLGLTPDAMAVASISPDQAVGTLGVVLQAQAAHQALAVQQAISDEASEQASDLATALVQGYGDANTAAAYEAACAQFDAAIAQIDEIHAALFAEAAAVLSTPQREALVTMGSGALHSVPPEFRVRERTPQEWKAIKRALRAEGRALRMGEELAEEHTLLLATVRSDPLVVQAAANLQTNLPAMEVIFDQVAQGVDAP